jgi:catechol 2,3-dioxygenase-like lactoylglutathione lyase family enzyme
MGMTLHHVAVVCRSMGNADRFYGEVLGLKKVKEAFLDQAFMDALFGVSVSSLLVKYTDEQLLIEVFVLDSEPSPPPLFAHSCFAVHDREAFLTHCHRAGVTVTKVPKGNDTVVFVEDFDGNRFEIKEAP